MPGDRAQRNPTAPAVTCLLRPPLLTRVRGVLWAGRSRRSLSALQRSRANLEGVPWRAATGVVPCFGTATSGRDRVPAMLPKRSQ
jgi:hypothetical protein